MLSDAQRAPRMRALSAQNKRPPRGRPLARDDRSDGRRDEGAGGLRLSADVGERVAPDPAEQLRPVLM